MGRPKNEGIITYILKKKRLTSIFNESKRAKDVIFLYLQYIE